MKIKDSNTLKEVLTWDEFLEYGRKHGERPFNGDVPWSFKFHRAAITHEEDDLYIVTTKEGSHYMSPDKCLIRDSNNSVYTVYEDSFKQLYNIETKG